MISSAKVILVRNRANNYCRGYIQQFPWEVSTYWITFSLSKILRAAYNRTLLLKPVVKHQDLMRNDHDDSDDKIDNYYHLQRHPIPCLIHHFKYLLTRHVRWLLKLTFINFVSFYVLKDWFAFEGNIPGVNFTLAGEAFFPNSGFPKADDNYGFCQVSLYFESIMWH